MNDIPQKIVSSESSKICAIAAPGAGKTTSILLPKINQVLADENVDADEVVLLTFSRMSANDLRKKVGTMEKVPVTSTVHSYCLAFLLSENNHDIRSRVGNVLLDFEKEALLFDLKMVFPQTNKNELKSLLNEFSAGWATKQQDEIFNEDGIRKAFKSAINNWLVEHEAAMMEEIIYYAVDLAKKVNGANLIERPKYIFVDEFQDLNKLEQEFIDILAENSKLLLVVGDPDQSIYSFKFAHREGIKEFGAREDIELHEWSVTRRCPIKVIEIANQFLQQIEPARTKLLEPFPGAIEGYTRFVMKDFQSDEFNSIIEDIADKIKNGDDPASFLILVPKKKLGVDFVEYANSVRDSAGIPDEYHFSFNAKPEFSLEEQKRFLLLALLVNPDSISHSRTFVGLGDKTYFAKEIIALKIKYGNIGSIFSDADPNDFPNKNKRIKALCLKIQELRNFLQSHSADSSLEDVLDELFPIGVEDFAVTRKIIDDLREDNDSLKSFYLKFSDHIRTVPFDKNTIPVMTIMASKGLDSEHVYIMGCNAGNVPGENRSIHMDEINFRNEQLRLLFVGVTRAKKTLMISWSRYILFQQSRGHHTQSVSTQTINGKTYSKVSLSDFLQDLSDVTWET